MTKQEAEDIDIIIDIYCEIAEAYHDREMGNLLSTIMRLGNILSRITQENADKIGYIWDYHEVWKELQKKPKE